MPQVAIDDLDDPRLSVYRHLNQVNLTGISGRFIAEGRWVVERLLASSLQTESIVCATTQHEFLAQVAHVDIPVYTMPPDLVSTLIGFQFHRGVLACGLRPRNPILREMVHPTHERSAQRPSEPASQLVVICPNLVDQTNVAGVVRNCSAFGATALILGRQCADPFSRRVVRVSMGNVFRLPVRVSDDLTRDLRELRRDFGFEMIATVLDHRAKRLEAVRQRAPRVALLFGSEGHGLEPVWLAESDHQVTLEMSGTTDSLNVSTASGIFLYHFTRLAQ